MEIKLGQLNEEDDEKAETKRARDCENDPAMESLLLADHSVAGDNKSKEHKGRNGDEEKVDSIHEIQFPSEFFTQQLSRDRPTVIIAGAVVGPPGLTTA